MNYAIAFGAYLVGLTTRVVCVKATTNAGGDLQLGGLVQKNETDKWKETRLRVRESLRSIGIDPGFTITFDHEPRRTPSLDLAIFAACLGALGKLPSDWFANVNHNGAKLFFGELGLNGEVRPSNGVLPMLISHEQPSAMGNERQFVIPYDCANEASHADTGTNVYALKHVSELFDLSAHTVARCEYKPIEELRFSGETNRLPARVVRAIEIAAIGRHPIHFVGSLAFKAARLLHDLLPPMTRDEARESAAMHSIAGLLRNDERIGARPFRAPSVTTEAIGLVGGGDPPRPGELSLAHHGVLYLDSLPQFKRGAIEPLASFLREGRATIIRSGERSEFAAKPLLVTGCTRCPCQPGKPHSDYCAERKDRKVGEEFRESFYLGWQRQHTDTLGIEMVVDVDFTDDDKPCSEDVQTLRRWVACGIEFGKRDDLEFGGESVRGRLARTVANREGCTVILGKHWERASTLVA